MEIFSLENEAFFKNQIMQCRRRKRSTANYYGYSPVIVQLFKFPAGISRPAAGYGANCFKFKRLR